MENKKFINDDEIEEDFEDLSNDIDYCFECGMWGEMEDSYCNNCGTHVDDIDMDDIPGFRD